MPSTPQPRTPRPLTIGRVRVGPHKSIGVGQHPLLALPGEDYAGKVLQIQARSRARLEQHPATE